MDINLTIQYKYDQKQAHNVYMIAFTTDANVYNI